jgi:hypothetical protein
MREDELRGRTAIERGEAIEEVVVQPVLGVDDEEIVPGSQNPA